MTAGSRIEAIATTLFRQIKLFSLVHVWKAPDRDAVAAFAPRRVEPLRGLLFAARHLLDTPFRAPTEMVFFYNTADWPADAPPAGWLHEPDAAPIEDGMRSLLAFWLLQAEEGHGAPRLARGMLWTLHRHGYRKALEFLIDSVASGAVTDLLIVIDAMHQLLVARRQVADDSLILACFVRKPPADPAAWRGLSLNRVDPARPQLRPDLADDIEWLRATTLQRIAATQQAPDPDSWIVGVAEIGRICRVLSHIFQEMGLESDLAFGAFAARIEEIQADRAMFFTFMGDGLDNSDRAALPWVPASTMARLASHHGPEWLDQVMEERVLVPDALLDFYFEDPETFTERVDDPWLLPSPGIRAALGDALIREAPYPFLPVGTGMLPIDHAAFSAEIARGDVAMDAEEVGAVMTIVAQSLSQGSPPLAFDDDCERIAGVPVPGPMAARLKQRTGLDSFHLDRWIAGVYHPLCMDFAIEALGALMQGEPAHFPSLNAFVAAFPNLAVGHLEHAIALDRQGDTEAAWTAIATALVQAPDNVLLWQSAAVILARLGEEREALVARFMAEYLPGPSAAAAG